MKDSKLPQYMTKKNIIFSDDFHGIWESLIFDSDVKAQVRNTLIFLTCVVFDIEIMIVIFSSLSFLFFYS